MKTLKKITALLVMLVMVFSVTAAYATGTSNEMLEPYTYDAQTGTFTFTAISEYGMTEISAGMFQGAEVMTKEILIEDEGITSIGDQAFLNCFRLEKITIPSTVTSIADSAFYGCDDVTIYGEKRSAAAEFADEHGFTFKEVSNSKKDTEGKVSTGIEVTILGIVVVFLILLILCFVLKAFEKVFSNGGNAQQNEIAAPLPTVQQEAPAQSSEEDDTELVAVIMAAIAAGLNTSTYNLRIKSIKRLGSSWNQNARTQNFNNNF